jgi:uncharacterized protein (TIGR00255 family)
MIKSMTGFGRWEALEGNAKIRVEIRSVNHRYLDLNIKMPKKFVAYENVFRTIVKQYVSRGKVDVFIHYEELEGHDINLQYNAVLAQSYLSILGEMKQSMPQVTDDVTLTKLAMMPEVILAKEAEQDAEENLPVVKQALHEAGALFLETRQREGEQLKADLYGKLDEMENCVTFIIQRSPQIIEEYKNRITQRIGELLADTKLDESRIAMEVTMFADKVCVDEELVRLKSHIATMRETLEHGVDVGRKLDFIAQEMNREANTILSKSNDLEITNCGINLKTVIEKVREQVQNVE